MITREQLIKDIRLAFGSVPYPEHGLRAAMAMDDWISDPEVLHGITAEKDIHGEWWEIPDQELKSCGLAISYLDSCGFEFYLPAYMTMALGEFTYPSYHSIACSLDSTSPESDAKLRDYFRDRFARGSYEMVLHFLGPPYDDADRELRENFLSKMSRIDGDKRSVCISFLRFLQQAFDPDDSPSPYPTVNRMLQSDFDRIARIRGHEFWTAA